MWPIMITYSPRRPPDAYRAVAPGTRRTRMNLLAIAVVVFVLFAVAVVLVPWLLF